MNLHERFDYLLDLYLAERISPEEKDELFNLLISSEFDSRLEAHITASMKTSPVVEDLYLPTTVSEDILQKILQQEDTTSSEITPASSKRRLLSRITAAAAVIAGLTIGLFFLLNKQESDPFTALIKEQSLHHTNRTDTLQYLVLADGSRITLYPGASFHYPTSFSDSVREVYIDGDAFFEVQPDAVKPFLVYSRHIVTRVLGTSFLISVDPESGVEEVAVKTGRVQVSENIHALNKETEDVPPVIITPNQKAIYESGKRVLFATLVSQPQPLTKDIETPDISSGKIAFRYDQEKLSTIFQDLETVYGVTIRLETEHLANCLFTGDLSDNDLFTQLRIICLATHSSYELKGTEILIKGQGCN